VKRNIRLYYALAAALDSDNMKFVRLFTVIPGDGESNKNGMIRYIIFVGI